MQGKLYVEVYEKTMNADKYIKILEENILPLCKNNKNLIYQQDNASCHTSFKTLEFFFKK